MALRDQEDAITIVGAQVIYLRSVDLDLSVASYTSDADLGLDPKHFADEPRLQQAMTNAGFVRASADLAGCWSRDDRVDDRVVKIPVDLLVSERLSEGGRRSVQIPPHDKMSARRVPGLEAAVVDNDLMAVSSLEPDVDTRVIMTSVAGPAALLVAKAYKIRDRVDKPGKSRLNDKDAGDVVRLMMIDEGPPEVASASTSYWSTTGPVRSSRPAWAISTTCSAREQQLAPRWPSRRSPVVSTSERSAHWHRVTLQLYCRH